MHITVVLTSRDRYLTFGYMSVIRGTSLVHYPQLVTALGGDPDALLRSAGIRPSDVGQTDAFIPYLGLVQALELAATATGTPDFGRQLALRQGIEVLGPVGVAARTAASVADAFGVFETYLGAYSPAIATRITALNDPDQSFYEFRVRAEPLPPHPQVIELSLGVTLRVFRFLLGERFAPIRVHFPHEPLNSAEEYRSYFSCPPVFAERAAGLSVWSADLTRAIDRDDLTHHAVIQYLKGIVTTRDPELTEVAVDLVGRLLPTGAVTLTLIAAQFGLHPKAFQRRLSAEGSTFAHLLDEVRRQKAESYLRDTNITLTHLARELGYAEQSVLTRSCRRWFGVGPTAARRLLRSSPNATPRSRIDDDPRSPNQA